MAVLALEWSSTRRCSRTRRGAPRPASWERRAALPSTATTWVRRAAASDCTQRMKQPSRGWRSSRAQTRPKVSCEGMPCGNARNVASQDCFRHPKLDLDPAVGAADDGQGRMQENVLQRMPPGLGPAGIVDFGKQGNQGHGSGVGDGGDSETEGSTPSYPRLPLPKLECDCPGPGGGSADGPHGPSPQWSVPDSACGDLLMDSLMPSFLVEISDTQGIRVATRPGCTT